MFRVDEETVLRIITSYGRNKKSLEEDVERIHEWLQTQPHFPEIMDKKRIENFLLMNKFRIETTKKRIDNYYTIRSAVPEFFQDVDSAEMERFRKTMFGIQLPKLTQEGHRVHVIKLQENVSLEKVHPCDFVTHAIHTQEIRLKEDVVYKDIIIYDMHGFTWSYLIKLTPTFMYKMFKFYEKVYSSRFAALYILNAGTYVDKMLVLFKTALKPKLFQRLEVLKDEKDLLQKLPKQILPKDFGGDEQPLTKLCELQQQKLNEYKEYLKTLSNMKVDESLRPEKLKDDDLLGFYGNFKKLEVD